MARKTVIMSDISGTTLGDENHATVIVKHPDNASRLKLDMSTDEAAQLVESTLRFYEIDILAPNVPPRRVMVETKTVDKLFQDFEDVLAKAEPYSEPGAPARSRTARAAEANRKAAAVIGFDVDTQFGQLHRGRITEREKELVRNHLDQAKAHRAAQGRAWDDVKEAERYDL